MKSDFSPCTACSLQQSQPSNSHLEEHEQTEGCLHSPDLIGGDVSIRSFGTKLVASGSTDNHTVCISAQKNWRKKYVNGDDRKSQKNT